MFRNLSLGGLGIRATRAEVIEMALSFGFKSMTLDMGQFLREVESFGVDHARRLIDSAQIKIGVFELPLAWDESVPDEASYQEMLATSLPQVAQFAEQLGCERALATVAAASDARPFQENFEFHRKRLGEMAEVLGRHNVRLGLRMVATPAAHEGRAYQFIREFDQLVQLAKASGANVGVVADVFQMHLAGAGPKDLRQLSAEQIIAVELSDIAEDVIPDDADEKARQMPGDSGIIDAKGVIAALAEIGYEGPITVRAERRYVPGRGKDGKAQAVAKRLDELFGADQDETAGTEEETASDEENAEQGAAKTDEIPSEAS